ncbi:hypothetical protein MVEN_00929800 [Mycena venus]|uniref:Uncharacterized protein n=1 Tax=Mycena venus TaxID=2733690 RepID=A0A8H7CZ69_9AGAR|nr:hypothetical protein MVEN_00929800 [Mycena venus]
MALAIIFRGGIFYNDHRTDFQPLLGSTSGLEDARDKAFSKRRGLTNCDLREGGVDVPARETDRDWGKVSRSKRQGVAARTKPYDLSTRKRLSFFERLNCVIWGTAKTVSFYHSIQSPLAFHTVF